jgi:hypothetical protein
MMLRSESEISQLDCSWNVMAHVDAREEKWRGNWRMDWVARTLYTTSELGVSSITTVDVHTSAASSRLNWRPCRFKWTRPFRRKTKFGLCACAITFQTHSTTDRTKAHPSCKGCATCNSCVSRSHVLKRTSTLMDEADFRMLRSALHFSQLCNRLCVISSFYRDVNEVLVFLGCYLFMEWPYIYNLPSMTAKSA